MELDEIRDLYVHAKYPDEEVFILAQLTCSDPETIIEILTDMGVYKRNKIKMCIVCHEAFIDESKYGRRRTCPTCRLKIKKIGNAEYYRKYYQQHKELR
jgi:predicted RNA-binding Zn ribbon-like protein